MSSLRPSARATGPDGREWEIYAYRARVAVATGRLRRIRNLFAQREHLLADAGFGDGHRHCR